MKFAIILSGSGVYDGTELTEAVLTFLALDEANIAYTCYAPDMAQQDVINHLTGQAMPEQRNVLVESARIARGDIHPLDNLEVSKYDAVVFPGGFGAAKNLSDFAAQGANMTIHPLVESILKAAHHNQIPIGTMCIAPVLAAKVIQQVTLTIGSDNDTLAAIEAMGAHHQIAAADAIVVDTQNRVVSTPAYMSATRVKALYVGITQLVNQLRLWCDEDNRPPS